MREQQKTEIKVGLTVLVALIVIIFGFSYFKNWGVGDGGDLIRMRFSSSAGLQEGDQVTINGVRAGEVVAVRLDGGGVLVDASLLDGMHVSADAHPVIQMLELMGGKKIDIHQGSASGRADTSVVLDGRVDPDISGALSFVGDMEGDLKSMQRQADTLLRNLNGIVGDRELIASIRQTAENLQAISTDTRAYLRDNRSNLEQLTGDLAHLVTTADTLITEMRPGMVSSLDRAGGVIEKTDSLVTTIHDILSEIRQSKGLLHSVVYDTALVGRLDSTLDKLNRITDIIINGEFKTNVSLF
jgi:phospholipid/cholesterol/gamma-HCH transport system substrate-binding protein